MLIHVICELGKAKAEFDLPCGDGQKSIKCVGSRPSRLTQHRASRHPTPLLAARACRWLATVAAARFASRGNGRAVRSRDIPNTRPRTSSYIPSAVTTAEQTFYHPDSLVAEQARVLLFVPPARCTSSPRVRSPLR